MPEVSWQDLESCRTLVQVHEVLVRLRPPKDADAVRWRAYRLRGAAAYERIADIDRGHHHEALYWSQRERRAAGDVARDGGERS